MGLEKLKIIVYFVRHVSFLCLFKTHVHYHRSSTRIDKICGDLGCVWKVF